jgi:ribosomal protein L37E
VAEAAKHLRSQEGGVTAAPVLALPDSPPILWTTHRPLLPRNRLRRGPLVDFPLENLRTGNSLYCVGWRNGKSWFLTSEQYFRLVDLGRESACVNGKSKADNEKENADDLPESIWTYNRAEPFNPSGWEMKSWGWWENPAEPQPPPEVFLGADRYSCVIGPDSWRDVAFILSLKRKTLAKKEKNLMRFAAEKKRLCAERKTQFKAWNKKLRETLGSHGNSHNGGSYETENCPRCGASVFTTKRHVCLDCGYTLGELHYQPRTQDLTSYRDARGWSSVQEITRLSNQRRRRQLTSEQFAAGLILRGQFENLTNVAALEKASGTYQILCERWLPRDVAAFSNDSERAIAARAERLFDTVTEHEAKGEPLPQPNINEINHLKHHFMYLRNEIPSLRSDLCIN